jgi:hypothetical protein
VEQLLVQARALVDDVVVVETDADVPPVEPGIAPLLVLIEAQVAGQGDLPAPGRSGLDTGGVAGVDDRSPPDTAHGAVEPAGLVIFSVGAGISVGVPPVRGMDPNRR